MYMGVILYTTRLTVMACCAPHVYGGDPIFTNKKG